MNGRTCQLCGKPLSRIWAGSGGDFCSREHRNQHRLRCGMDTLLEANKHANLMRRRDHLRQFSVLQLRSDSTISPQAFGPLAAPPVRPALRRMGAAYLKATPILGTGGEHFLPLRAPGGLRGRFAVQPQSAGKMGFPSSPRTAPLPRRGRLVSASFPRAEVAPIRFHLKGPGGLNGPDGLKSPDGARRTFVMLTHSSRGALLSGRAFRRASPAPLGSLSGKRLRNLTLSAKAGHAFRVSSSKGFRPPPLKLRQAALTRPAAPVMMWPESLTLPGAAFAVASMKPHSSEQCFRVAALCLPVSQRTRRPQGLHCAGAIRMRLRPPLGNRPGGRALGLIHHPDGRQVLRGSGLRPSHSPVGPGCIALKLIPAGAAAQCRLERAPFQPQDQAWINISYSWNASR